MCYRLLLVALLVMCVKGFGAEQQRWERPVKFGLVTYFSLRHTGTELGQSIKPAPSDRTHYLDAIRELGVSTVRDAIVNWAEIQPEQNGPYDFAYLDDLVHKASARGIEVVGLVYFFPPWATIGEDRPWNYPNDGRYKLPLRRNQVAFRRFVHAAVERYCGCRPGSLPLKLPVRKYIFMNEAEAYAGELLAPDDYAYWLRTFTEEARAVSPTIKVVAPALVTPGVWRGNYLRGTFLDRLLSSKDLKGPGWPYFDILDYHPYPRAYGDLYGIDVATSYIRYILALHKLQIPIWITEIGDNSADETTQEDHIVQYVIHAASMGVERVYVFGMTDYGTSRWGLLRDVPSGQLPVRKLSFVAYKTLLAKISDNQRIDFLGPGRYRVFRKDRPPVYVLWATGGSASALPFLHGRLLVTDLMGRTRAVDAEHLKLDMHPVLVESRN